jgi:hypothetical protein
MLHQLTPAQLTVYTKMHPHADERNHVNTAEGWQIMSACLAFAIRTILWSRA